MNLLKNTKILRSHSAVAAGATDSNGAAIDFSGFEGCVFVAAFGTLTATQVTGLKFQHGDAANLSDAADVAGTLVGPMADGDSSKNLALEIHKPTKRYGRLVIKRGTANAVIEGAIAILYTARLDPVAQDVASVVLNKVVASPISGTP